MCVGFFSFRSPVLVENLLGCVLKQRNKEYDKIIKTQKYEHNTFKAKVKCNFKIGYH